MSESGLSPLRKIRLFFPPADSPLLTTYTKALLPKIDPLKRKYSVLSQRRERASECPETVYMNTYELDSVNSSYLKIKQNRGEETPKRESEYRRDPLYRSLYDMKHKAVMSMRTRSKRNISKLNLSQSNISKLNIRKATSTSQHYDFY